MGAFFCCGLEGLGRGRRGASRSTPRFRLFGFQEIGLKLVVEIAGMIRRMVQGIPVSSVEYLGRFLFGNFFKPRSRGAWNAMPQAFP